MKDMLKRYLLQKLRELEEGRQAAHRVPADVIPGEELRGRVMRELDLALGELVAEGLIHKGDTLNGLYYKLDPEGAIDE